MKNTLFRLLGLGQPERPRLKDSKGMSTPPANTQQHTDIQRELIRVVLKDTLRQHGIPSSWVGCEVTVLPRRAVSGAHRGAGHAAVNPAVEAREALFVHLIIMIWSDALVHFAPALQQQLLQALDRFEPAVDHSHYVVAWRFSPQCRCPYQRLPDPMFWTQEAFPEPQGAAPLQPAAAMVRVGVVAKPKFDLPPSRLDNIPSGFAPTEPGPLR